MRTKFDIGQIIRCHLENFLANHRVVPAVAGAFAHMAMCRTSALGGHVEVCPQCGDTIVSYNSCRDRHCPKCQNKEREQWISSRREELIPTKYFHVVFTVPACLHTVAMANQAVFYNSMFKAAWDTVKAFADNRELLMGMTAVLHTWGSNLFYHPHIHCIVPGGGTDKDGAWKHLNGCRGSDFLFPVAAMSDKFRGRFMALLTGKLKKEGAALSQNVRKQCFDKSWVVYAKPPAKGAEQVVEYIGRYAYRVAITNSRILDVRDGKISYDYKMYRKGGKHGVMTMDIDAFLNLLSMHILPDRFVRIRHYGLLSSCNRKTLRNVQRKLDVKPVPKVRKKKSCLQISLEKGWDIGVCKHCGCQRIVTETFKPKPRAPPFRTWNVR